MVVGKSYAQVTPADVWAYVTRVLTNFPDAASYTAARAAFLDVAVSSRLGKTPELIDIRLNGGTTQLLAVGIYICCHTSDAYAEADAAQAAGHLENFSGGAWNNWASSTPSTGQPKIIYSDGTNWRFANGAAAGTWLRFVGVRLY